MSGPDNRPASGGEATQTVSGGVLLAGSAFALWGVLPLFYKALGHVPVLDVLAHRGIWALVFLALIVTLTRRWAIVAGALTSPRVLGLLVVTGVLIGGNWGGFIYAVDAGRVLEASLGYFINPLVNVALGVLLLGAAAVTVAGVGTVINGWHRPADAAAVAATVVTVAATATRASSSSSCSSGSTRPPGSSTCQPR